MQTALIVSSWRMGLAAGSLLESDYKRPCSRLGDLTAMHRMAYLGTTSYHRGKHAA
jgi:hypothetical protein